ncbi:MAG: hypothetical protein ACM31O_22705 [Bacteroidota bacterium]|jgi:hypothetical protein
MNENRDPLDQRPIPDSDLPRVPGNTRGYSYLVPAAVIAVLLLLGIAFLTNNEPTTGVGQTVERPATNPAVPRDPNATPPKQ